ncbi:MAG: CHAT domain-containing protein [Chloroflexi bacterium]|nr:CHAT domain-containing protein [Chloroflexota bacterium]
MLLPVIPEQTIHRPPLKPPTFVDKLLLLPETAQRGRLATHLHRYPPAAQDEIARLLKQQADRYMRTDLQCCLHVAGLIKWMAELTGNPLFHALGLRAEGNAYAIGGSDYRRGIACYDEAAAIYGRHQHKLEQAWSQNGKIYALANLGHYTEALSIGEWAGQVFREAQEWLPLAELTVNLAIIHGRLGQDTAALTLLDQARSLYQASGDQAQDRLLVVEMNRAIILRNLGRFTESITVNQSLLQTYTQRGAAVDTARAQQNLALTYFVLGRYNEALTLLDAAGEGFRQDGRSRHAMLVELFTSDCLLQLRRFGEALEKCRRARQLFDQLGAPYEIGRCLLHEAHAFTGLGQHAEALASLLEARALFEQEGNRSALADADLHIAALLLSQQQAEDALTLARLAEAVYREHNQPLGQARAWLLAAQSALALNKLEKAEEMVTAVLSIATAHNLPTLTYQGYHLQGALAARQGDRPAALSAWQQGIAALEQLVGRLMLEYRADFAQDKMRLYEDVVDLYLADEQPEAALNIAERAKSRALRDLLANRLDLRIEARSPADQPLVEQILALRAERDNLYRRWQTGEQPGQREDYTAQLSAQQTIGQRVADVEKEITAVWHKLLVRNAAYAQEATLWQVHTEPIQPYLDDATILLEFFSLHDQIVVFLVTRQEVRAARLPVSLAQVQQLLQLLWLNLRAVPHSHPARQTALADNARGILHKLYQQLFAPVRPLLQGYQRLIVVPHGPLHYLPCHALFDGQAYLLAQFEMSYLPSASMLRYCQTAVRADGGLLALGYSGDGRLPHAPHEAQSIAQMWGGTTLLEQEATLENLRQHTASYRLIHLATHGEFRPDNPLFSGLALADGWLTTLDIFNLRLQASLVTLSACQTGRSLVGGGDELLGLMRAFLSAGAASLLATFWPVEDMSTAALMGNFYRALTTGASKGSALRQAQLHIIDQHPYFWAPFFLVGDTGPL